MPRVSQAKSSSENSAKTPRTITLPSFKINLVGVLVAALVLAAFVLGVLITTVFFLAKGSSGSANNNAGTDVGANAAPSAPAGPVNVKTGHFPILGDKNAKVTIIEFADFQCPFCEDFYKNIEPNIKKDYVDSGKANFSFRHYAFLGQESTDSALASECANEQDKFWEYHDYLYTHQGPENSGAFAKDKLKGFAADLGLDTAKFNDCLDSAKYQKNVDKDVNEGQTAGVDGTPATFVNGILISGAAPYADFKKQIDSALSK